MSDNESDHDDEGSVSASSVGASEKMFMFQTSVRSPREFSFRSEEWERWRNRWTRYQSCSGLSSQEDSVRIDTMIYTMGQKAEDVLLSFRLPVEPAPSYSQVLKAFDKHFGVRVNVVLERQRFKRGLQGPGESVDDLLADLHRLARV
jgi:hypothetical protein